MSQKLDLSLHLVTDDRLPIRHLATIVDQAVAGGVSVVQYRNKHADDDVLEREAKVLASIIGDRAVFLINDHLDVALTLRRQGYPVDGVHLGQSDGGPVEARLALGANAVVGWTANTTEHLAVAHSFPAGTIDYLGVGVIRATATKVDAPEVLGVQGFRSFTAQARIPTVAIGGIVTSDAANLAKAGAAGIAVVSAICAAANPFLAASEFRQLFISHT